MADDRNRPNNPKGVQIESIINRDDGSLPFGYFEPSQDGKLTWNCGYDAKGRIISVFCYDFGTHKDKKASVLDTMDAAIYARDELIKAGWHKLKPPEITVKYAEGDERPLTRKQKRYLARTLKKMAKDNPFEDGEANSSGEDE